MMERIVRAEQFYLDQNWVPLFNGGLAMEKEENC